MSLMNPTSETIATDIPGGELVNTLRQPAPEPVEASVVPHFPEVPDSPTAGNPMKVVPVPDSPTAGIPKKVVPVPDSPLSAPNSIREMLEKKRREGNTSYRATPTAPATPHSPSDKPPHKKITPVPDSPLSMEESDPDMDLAIQELSEIMLSGKPLQQNPDGSISVRGKESSSEKSSSKKHIPVPDSPLSAQQWYQRDPELYSVDLDTMREYLDDPDAEPEMLSDGRLFWDVTITPKTENYTGMDYRCMAIYDHNHPHAAHGSSVEIHPIDPTLDEIEEVFITSPVVKAYCKKNNKRLCLPHTIIDEAGNRFLCNMDRSITTNDLSKGIISAKSSILCANKYFLYLEGAVLTEENCAKFFAHEAPRRR